MAPIRVLHGQPNPEEIAAVLAVVSARAAQTPAAAPPEETTAWRDKARRLQAPPKPGPSTWRTSAWAR
ncbi:hypothetical protein ABH940_006392 [Streptacidiphilus sp. BW17]|uniref:acyl-CoA carboxylase subunit epsilon n=1 Tax=Streptacidiphilus sp. BW17 TaxID=3156274 RepID=UPI003512A9D5